MLLKEVGKDLLENITIRLAVESDIPQMVNLMNSQYSREKDENYFLWQYFNSYYPTISMGAFIDITLIGMFGLQKRKLESGAYVGQAIDLLIAPEWRKKGIFKSLYEKVIGYFPDLDLLCVLPNQNGKNACEKTLGWNILGKINSMFLLTKHLKSFSMKTLSLSSSIKEHVFARFDYNDKIRKWRFDQHPEYKYTYVRLVTGEFAITKVFKDPVTGARYGDIVDFECDLNNQKLLRELFLQACIDLKSQHVESITTWALPHTPLYRVVESLGFIELPQERYFVMRVLNHKYEYLYDLSRWHLVQADCEIY